MRYLLLIYEEPPATPPTDEEWAAMMAEYNAFGGLGRREGLVPRRRGAPGRLDGDDGLASATAGGS